MNITFDDNRENVLVSGNDKLTNKNLLKYFPGNIQDSEQFLNLICRLIVFFRKILNQKSEYITNIFNLQYYLLNEWIDFRTLRGLFPRLIFFLNNIKFSDYAE